MTLGWVRALVGACAVVGFVVVGVPAADAPDEIPFVEGQPLPAAKPNEGWTLVCRSAVYKTVTEQVEVRPAGSYLEPVPAKWEARNETIQVSPETKVLCVVPAKHEKQTFKVLIRPESTRLEIIPARYENVEEEVVVEAAREERRTIPATYRTVSERIEVAPAYTYWKRVGGGERIHSDGCSHCGETVRDGNCSRCSKKTSACDCPRVKIRGGDGCGDSFCLCEVPAKFVTVCKQVIDKEATTETVTIPAKTKRVCVQRLVADAEVRKVVCPAEYATMERGICAPCEVTTSTVPAKFETICKQVLVEPASTRKVEIPAKFETICKQVLDQPAKMVWRRIKCDCGDVVRKYKEIPGTDEGSLMYFKK